AKQSQDQRVSAVKANVAEPQLLFTLLGRVNSLAGRELERVLAVQLSTKSVCKVYDSPDDWSALTDPARAIRTTDLWKNHFASWGTEAQDRAISAARSAFTPAANQFTEERRGALEREMANQSEWLKKRVQEVTGTSTATTTTRPLFDTTGTTDV